MKRHAILRTFFAASLLAFIFFSISPIEAQPLKKVKEFKPGAIENVAIDRLGDFFLVFTNGEIKKYDAQGKVLAALKASVQEKNAEKIPALIEPWFHPAIFIYHRQTQRYLVYDRNFQNPDSHVLDPAIAINPLLACPTNDNKLLVLDGADYSIKKVNPRNSEVTAEFYIDTLTAKPNFVYMREYQNLIFLLDKNVGIVIYNTVGKKVNQLKTDSNNFGFFGEELYFLQQDKIVFFDLYTEKIRVVEADEGKFVLVSDERILLVKENGRVILFEFSEKDSTDH